MRLSIPFLFLIGAMVATQVMCDTITGAEEVCNWFEPTLDRLENGQTLKQNRLFIDLVNVRANQLLESLTFATILDDTPLPQFELSYLCKPDWEIIDQIGAIQKKTT
jgi:hypothetical protein